MSKYAVILVAAGKSERFGGKEKKTFAKLDGRPIFLRSLEVFTRRDDVCQTILAVAPEDMEEMKSKFGANLGFMGVSLVEGGTARWQTVRNALQRVSDDATHVAVHDAARPCVTESMVDGVFAEAKKSGAAILACPLTGTLKRVGEVGIESTVSRENLYEAQTPQVFLKSILVEAYAKLGDNGDTITDDAQVVEQTGHLVTVVSSSPLNLKITSRSDMALAQSIIKTSPRKTTPKLGAFDEAQW